MVSLDVGTRRGLNNVGVVTFTWTTLEAGCYKEVISLCSGYAYILCLTSTGPVPGLAISTYIRTYMLKTHAFLLCEKGLFVMNDSPITNTHFIGIRSVIPPL